MTADTTTEVTEFNRADAAAYVGLAEETWRNYVKPSIGRAPPADHYRVPTGGGRPVAMWTKGTLDAFIDVNGHGPNPGGRAPGPQCAGVVKDSGGRPWPCRRALPCADHPSAW